MSVVNVVASPRRIVLLTDSSLYDREGTITGFERKCIPVEAWNGAITFRGNCWGLVAGVEIGERHGSFDEFIARSAGEIERAYRAATEAGHITAQPMIEIHAAGWSERDDCAKAFILCGAVPGGWHHHPEFTWVPLHEVESSGILTLDVSDRALWRLHRQGAEPGVDFTAETFDPTRHGLPMLEEQRRRPADAWTGFVADFYAVGGQLWLTIVDRDDVRQSVIRTWPDVVGEPIRPEPIDESNLPKIVPTIASGWTWEQFNTALAHGMIDPETFEIRQDALTAAAAGNAPRSAVVPMSRKQRRAAEAQAKAERKKVRAHV